MRDNTEKQDIAGLEYAVQLGQDASCSSKILTKYIAKLKFFKAEAALREALAELPDFDFDALLVAYNTAKQVGLKGESCPACALGSRLAGPRGVAADCIIACTQSPRFSDPPKLVLYSPSVKSRPFLPVSTPPYTLTRRPEPRFERLWGIVPAPPQAR